MKTKIGEKIIFTKHENIEFMIYGKSYTILDFDRFYDPRTGELIKELVLVEDEEYKLSWFNLTYFNDINKLRLLKIDRLKTDG